MMNFDRYTVDLKHGSLVDYYVTHYWWAAKQNQFTYEQISIYYSIVHVLLENLRGLYFYRYKNQIHVFFF